MDPRRLVASVDALGQWFLGLAYRPRKSVLFISFQKCATTLFNEYVLRRLKGLRQVDYEMMIYRGRPPHRIEFEPSGRVYGVIRLNFIAGNPVYETLVKPILEPGFIDDKRSVFLIRDPRDIVVSRYYSIGFVHTFSENPAIRGIQERMRAEIQSQTLEEYVVAAAPDVERRMQAVADLHSACAESVVLRFEDLICDFERFARDAEQLIGFRAGVKRQLFARSRPRQIEDPLSHRRSGKVGGFREKLSPEVADRITEVFRPMLERFSYPLHAAAKGSTFPQRLTSSTTA